jgi:hypothetical protein
VPATSPPRISAFGFVVLFGALFVNTSCSPRRRRRLVHVCPNSSVPPPSNGISIWALGLIITGIARRSPAIN